MRAEAPGTQTTPAITWAIPAPITYGTALSAAQLNAVSSVPGSFTYSPAAGTVPGAGIQRLSATFTPANTSLYTTATAEVLLVVHKATPAITWAAPAPIAYGTALSSSQLNATSSVAGTFYYDPLPATVLPLGAHTLSVTFFPTDTADYVSSTATVPLSVIQASTPEITWAVPAPITYGTAVSAVQLNAVSSVPGSFTYSPMAGIVPSVGIQRLSATFTPTNAALYTTATAEVPLVVEKAPTAVTWPTPSPISYGTALSATQLNATSTIPGNFYYYPLAGTVLPLGTNTLSVTFIPTDTAHYLASKASVTVAIVSAPVANPGGPYSGTAGIAVSFSGSGSTGPSGQTLSYAWSFGDGTTGTGVSPTHTYTTGGTYTVSLTVSASGGGASAAVTTTATIVAAPVANPGGPYSGTAGVAVHFDGSKSTGPSGQTLSYAWSFGDGTTGTGVSPTHTYTTAGTYTVSLTVSASGGGTSAAVTTTATIVSAPVANPGGPYTGTAGVAVSFDGSKSTGPSGQTLSYAWSFGDGTTGTGVSPTHTYTTAGTYTVSLTVSASGGGTSAAVTTTAAISSQASPSISGFTPTSGSIGTLITLTGSNLAAQSGSTTQVTLTQQGGGTITAPLSTTSSSSLAFVIPPGAATGPVIVTVGTLTATSSSALTVTPASSFTLSVTPGTGQLIQGQSTSLAVSITSSNGFTGLATLSVSGLPSGVTASFQPSSVAVGQVSTMTLTAPAGQAVATSMLTITGAATIQGQAVTQTATASLKVVAISTSFLGRTVVDDAQQEPIAGVTVSFMGKDDKGNTTGCSGQTVSDGGGNFSLTNLPTACIGPQLISYNGMTATAPAGKYAGVNLSYTLVSGKVVASPVLVHLPRIDNAETVNVKQNSSTDQVFYFQSIPGVKVTVYAGTTLSLDDGSQPNPFPLVAIEIPIDRLPDQIPTSGMLTPFIVAFQPANAVASQPVAVNFPNVLSTPAGTHVTFVTLDPTHGYMVPYGTGTVSTDGTEFIADADPNHPGHAYGLVHFDWHGPAVPPASAVNPGPDGGNAPPPPTPPCPTKCPPSNPTSQTAGEPVDVSSGIVTYSSRDIGFAGARGGIAVHRVYRTLSSNPGPFGPGTSHEYNYVLNTQAFILTFLGNYPGAASNMALTMPDGNAFVFAETPNGSFTNSTIPALRGAVLTYSGTAPLISCSIRWAEGTTYNFTSYTAGSAYLTSIVDLNGNTTTITRNQSQPAQIISVTDPVGRSLTFKSDASNRITQIADPIGRKVGYTYNGAGTLASFTDANGGVTSYTYDSSNNLATITDPRGIVTEQNTFNEGFDGRITQQVLADGGVIKFAYTLQNPQVATSPVLQTVVTDPLGNQTTYRFNTQGFLVSVTDASGQTRTLTRDPDHFNLVSAYTGNGSCPVCGGSSMGDVHFTYDATGNVLTKTDALGNKTTFGYDTRFNLVNSVTDALGHTTKVVYDANGNPISVTDANGNVTQTIYDSFGEPIQITDPTGAKTAIVFDSFGNVTSVTNALGNATSLSYDGTGRLTQVQDALGRKGLTAYDALDRVTSVTDPLNNVTQLAYDPVGDLLTLTDPKGNATSFTYDSRQRLIKRSDPLKRQQSYVYDTDSNLTQFTDRRGLISKYSFDVMNRLTKATYQDSTVGYTFDPAGRLLSVNDSMDGDFAFQYDAAGRLLQQSEPTGVIRYTPDALGRVATEQVVGQPATNYTYDPVGNLLSAAMTGAGVTFTYDQRNLPLTLARTNGVTSTFSFDSIGELLSLVHSKGASVLNSFAYKYDPVGKRSQVTSPSEQALTTQSSTSTVDASNQLLTNSATNYTYDANGNRLKETTSTGTRTYTWDARNRLVAVSDGTGTTTLKYDYARNLLGITLGSGTGQSFVVDASTNVASFTPATGGAISILHGLGLDSHWASVNTAGAAVFGIGDALGSTAALTDANGNTSSTLSYEPYGQINGAVAANTFPFAYTGRVPVTGNVQYFRNRYYDSGVGRFLSEDPLGVASGANPYSYANGDPISFEDPDGLYSAISGAVDGGAGAASAAADCATRDPFDIGLGAALGIAGAVIGDRFGSGLAADVFLGVLAAGGEVEVALLLGDAAFIAGNAAVGGIFDAVGQISHNIFSGGLSNAFSDFHLSHVVGAAVGAGRSSILSETAYIQKFILGFSGNAAQSVFDKSESCGCK